MKTFYWYDYETFGSCPKTGRIAQFGGIRTDEDFNILDEHMFYCKPTHDCLPSPKACAVTGISPQYCDKNGVIEHQFIQKIHHQFSVPNTCIAGYNSIRFDDEFSRYTLYRNFIDPYAWHWQNGNTRWDILDVVRLCYALKKDASLNWVYDENEKPVFKLEQLSISNGIEHANAHDALADVRATIAIAKIIKTTQPEMFKYAFSLRKKKNVAAKIQLFEPMLHTSGMYPAHLSCTRLVAALAHHPEYSDRVIVFNLDQDPSILLELDTEELQKLAFTKQSELPEGVGRLQIKDLVFNKSPMFVPNVYKLDPKIITQLQIDMDTFRQHLLFIQKNQQKINKIIQDIYRSSTEKPSAKDVDQSLYDGFMDDADKHIGEKIQSMDVEKLKTFHPKFKDAKLTTLLLHFKARNYPQSLNQEEQEKWFETVQSRVQTGKNGYTSIGDYLQSVNNMRQQHPKQEKLWQQLEAYAESFF